MLGNVLLVIIGFIGLIFCGLSWHMPPVTLDWWKNALLNIGTGMITSIVVVFLYDGVLARREASRRNKIKRLAFELIGQSLFCAIFVLHELRKGTALEKPNKSTSSFSNTFDETFFKNIIGYNVESSWGKITVDSFIDNFIDFYESMDRIIKDYANYMDQETILILARLTNSEFIKYVRRYPDRRRITKEFGEMVGDRSMLPPFTFRGLIDGPRHFREFVADLIELINMYNKESKDKFIPDSNLWDVSIPVGSLRDNQSSK